MKSDVLPVPDPLVPRVRNRGSWTTLESEPWPGILLGQTTALTGRSFPCKGADVPLQLAQFLPGRSVHVPEQVHGSGLAPADAPGDSFYPVIDGLVTSRPGCLLMVRTADCVPVILYEPKTRSVGLLHAGWRGLVKDILPTALRKLNSPVHVVLGVHIHPDRYEIGEDVIHRLEDSFQASRTELRRKGILSPDNELSLARALREQARRAGSLLSFRGFPQDTAERSPPMFSHRRSGTEERMLTWVVRRSR